MIIDVHSHGLSEAFIVEMANTPGLGLPIETIGNHRYHIAGYGVLDPLIYDLQGRVESLKRRDVRLQLVGPPPPLISNGAKAADVSLARKINQSTAFVAANCDGLAAGLAAVPLGEPDLAADELKRAIDEHQFPGIVLSTSAGKRQLDDPAFDSLFQTIEDLDLFAFMHATTSALSATQTEYSLRTLVGWPTETTIAIARMTFAGVFERHPRLKLVLSHGGGTLANLLGRIDLGWSAPRYEANPACQAKISRPPSSYIRQLYFDTVVADPSVLNFVIDSFGADRVLFGSDFPYEIGDAEGELALPTLRGRTEAERQQILFANAQQLLGHRAPFAQDAALS
jgi:aminocarboxymuconate-semialdehyde decarboxylase